MTVEHINEIAGFANQLLKNKEDKHINFHLSNGNNILIPAKSFLDHIDKGKQIPYLSGLMYIYTENHAPVHIIDISHIVRIEIL